MVHYSGKTWKGVAFTISNELKTFLKGFVPYPERITMTKYVFSRVCSWCADELHCPPMNGLLVAAE